MWLERVHLRAPGKRRTGEQTTRKHRFPPPALTVPSSRSATCRFGTTTLVFATFGEVVGAAPAVAALQIC